MTEYLARLNLYIALCGGGPFPEGKIEQPKISDSLEDKQAYFYAINNINDHILTGHIQIIDYRSLLKCEEEVKLLTNLATNKIKGTTSSWVVPYGFREGLFQFGRILSFENWNKFQKNELISKLKECNVELTNRIKERYHPNWNESLEFYEIN